MTVPSEQSRIQYQTDGVSVSFPVPFRFIEAQHLRVTRQHGDLASTLTLGSDYTVSGANKPAGGTITTLTTYPAGDALSIERIVPVTQETAYQRNDPFPERAHEQALDKLTMICQMLAGLLGLTPGSLNRALLLGAADLDGKGSYRANGNRIQDLGAPQKTTDAARKQDILEALAGLSADGSGQFVVERLADSTSPGNGAGMIGFRANAPGAVDTTVQDFLRGWLTPQMFGAVGDGIKDDTAAMQAFAAAPAHNKYMPAARYKISKMLSFAPGGTLKGDGAATVIDASAATSWPEPVVVRCTGHITAMPKMAADAYLGDTRITLTDASGVKAGDVLIIYNPTDFSWSGWRRQYRAGEMMRVNRVEGNTVILMAPLYDNYTAVLMDVYRLDGKPTTLDSFVVLAPSREIRGVSMGKMDRPVMRNVYSIGALGASLEFEMCADIDFQGVAFQSVAPDNDDYGLCIASCHGGIVKAPSMYGGRHAVAIGGYDEPGAVTNRALTIQVGQMGNNAGIGAQDMHGNAEDIKFIGGSFSGGVIGGKNNTYIGCRFFGTPEQKGIALFAGEILGGEHKFIGCSFVSRTNPNQYSYGLISIDGTFPEMAEDIQFRFADCSFDLPQGLTYIARCTISGTSKEVSLSFSNPRIVRGVTTLNNFLRIGRNAGTGRFYEIAMSGVSGMPDGSSYVIDDGSAVPVSRYKLPAQVGRVLVPVVASANSQYSAAATYPIKYPATPIVVTSKALASVGGKRAIAEPTSLTASGFTAVVATADSGPFGNAESVYVYWQASLNN